MTTDSFFNWRRAQSLNLATADDEAILQARARELAVQPEADGSEASLEIVLFRLANEIYGLETAHVDEVYPLRDLTPVPCTPSFVKGVVNLRGQILSVVDLKSFFQFPEQGLADLSMVIVLANAEMRFGILADEILEVRPVKPSEIQPPLPTLAGARKAYLKGLTSQRWVILDAEKLLQDKAMVVQEKVE